MKGYWHRRHDPVHAIVGTVLDRLGKIRVDHEMPQFRGAERRAAALGVRLVVPLGLCSLPAFVCLGIVPVLLAMLPSGP